MSFAPILEALSKGAVAGLVVTGILLLRNRSQIAGVLLMMPVITATSFLFVGLGEGTQAAQRLALSALLAFPTAAVFILSMYLLLGRYGIIPSLALSYVFWALTATAYVWLTR